MFDLKIEQVEVSVVLPCFNEGKSIGICVMKAIHTLKKLNIKGEVIVSDNGSVDNSKEIAIKNGAKVVYQPKKGYGNACLKGLSEAKGKYLIIADSDNTYDLTELDRFIKPLIEGYDIVIGTRIKGRIMPGAMPWLHKYIGNPLLSWLLRKLFDTNISDAHCGMRSFTKDAYEKMNLRTTGMEFASEIVIKSIIAKLRIKEIPVTLYANKQRHSHIHPLRDSVRHFNLMIQYKFRYF